MDAYRHALGGALAHAGHGGPSSNGGKDGQKEGAGEHVGDVTTEVFKQKGGRSVLFERTSLSFSW
jgi:hypothetical protein